MFKTSDFKDERQWSIEVIAADVMATNVVTVHSDASVKEIAETLLANRISAVPVIDDFGGLIGIVSEGDLIHRMEVGTESHPSWWLEFLVGKQALAYDYIKSHGRRAADLMTRPVITVRAETPLSEIASLLDKHRIKRVPVVDNEKIIGNCESGQSCSGAHQPATRHRFEGSRRFIVAQQYTYSATIGAMVAWRSQCHYLRWACRSMGNSRIASSKGCN